MLALREAAKLVDLAELPGEISYGPVDHDNGTAVWFSDILVEIDMHHDGSLWTEWENISVLGLPLSEEIRTIAEAYGSVQNSGVEPGFEILNSGDGC